MFVDGAVDAPVDAREPRGHLVHRAVEVVDPALERDGEVDDVRRRAAEDRLLVASERPDAPPGGKGGDERDRRDRDGRDRNRELEAHDGAIWKMTGYSAVLLSVLVSPLTGSMLTWTVAFSW